CQIESFNGRLRDELLNEALFTSLAQAPSVRAAFKDVTITFAPQCLGDLTPSESVDRSACRPQWAKRCAMLGASPPHRLLHRAYRAQISPRLYLLAYESRGSGHEALLMTASKLIVRSDDL